MKTTIYLLAVTSVVASLSSAAYGQNALSSGFSIGVEADADQLNGGNSQTSFSDFQSGTLNPYSHSLSVTDTEANGGFVTTTSSASAAWTSAGAGTVTFRDMGWNRNSLMRHEAKLNGFVTGNDIWSYTFQATANGTFQMNYDVRGVGNTFGLLGVVIHWSDVGGDLDLTNAFDPSASGTFSRAITNGTTYTVGIANAGNIFSAADQGQSSGSMNADFNWNVNAVPEPLSLIALGLGLASLTRRRNRTQRPL